MLRYRREVAALYAELRASGSANPEAFGRFEAGCDALFAEHPQSPLDSAQRRSFSGLAELHQPYVRTATLKGIPRYRVILRHVLPNALLPAITVIAISFGWLISGLIVVENVFNYPGLGRLLTFAIDRRDLPLLQAITFVAVLGFALANLAADLLYVLLNPKIRLR